MQQNILSNIISKQWEIFLVIDWQVNIWQLLVLWFYQQEKEIFLKLIAKNITKASEIISKNIVPVPNSSICRPYTLELLWDREIIPISIHGPSLHLADNPSTEISILYPDNMWGGVRESNYLCRVLLLFSSRRPLLTRLISWNIYDVDLYLSEIIKKG